MNQRRSSFVVLSVTAHAIVLGALLATSLFAPGLLPVPRTALVLALERRVQPVDIKLPPPPRTQHASPREASAVSKQAPAIAAPIEPPDGIAPETGRESIGVATINSVAAVEGGGGSVDGVGIPERPPAAPPTPAPPPQRLHQGIQAPRKTVDVAPRYPTLAREIRAQGTVILDVIIDEHGAVTSSRVLKSVAFLDQAAIDAVQQWKFTPARLNGEAIPIVMTVTVTFRLQ